LDFKFLNVKTFYLTAVFFRLFYNFNQKNTNFFILTNYIIRHNMTLQISKLAHKELIDTIFGINDSLSFENVSIAVFKYQYQNCPAYKQFCDALNLTPAKITKLEDIPFMPADFFRKHEISCISKPPELCFYSSSTTGTTPSRHYVADLSIYDESINRCFEMFFGSPSKYCFLALLPGYLERKNSSLVYMVKKLMELSGHKKSGFFLHDFKKLRDTLEELSDSGNKFMLIGVSHALLGFAEKYSLNLKDAIILETGGMKGQRKEIIRRELHERLKEAFGVKEITSEYGMTELLSQAYALKSGKFKTPNWMKVFFRELNDPLNNVMPGRNGSINIVDLANVHSCSFIATQDLGKQNPDSTFEVLGRMDNSEIRGCNLMVS